MTTFDSFRPSFLTLGAGAVRDLFERAYKDGASHIQRKEETTSPENGTFSHEGVVRGELSFSNLRHGHYPAAAAGIPSELSGFAPFRLSATYKDGALEEVTLELFLLNPRFLISETRWYPASFASGHLTPLTGEPAPWGVFLAGDGSQTAEALRKGLPSKTLPESRGASLRREYDENTILGRLDLSMKWSIDKLGQAVADHFGRIPGIPNASLPEGLGVVSLQFFSPEVDHGFDALLSAGKTFGIRLPTGADATPLFLVEGRKDEKPDKETAKCLTALGLPADFQGLVFKGIEAFLLSDDLREDAAPLSVKLGVSAIATGDAPGTSYRSRLLAEYTPPAGHGAQKAKARGVTSWLRSAQLDAILDDTGLSVSLSGTFGELDGLFGWLSNRRAQIFWRDLPGSDPIYAIEVEQAEGGDMVSLTPDTLGMSREAFNVVGAALALGPVLMLEPSKDPARAPHAIEPFRVVRTEQGLAQLLVARGLGSLFKDALTVSAIRVVGIGLQRQPAKLTDPNENTGRQEASDTAILLDYEIDFRLEELGETVSSETITARVDGSGLAPLREETGDVSIGWVQVASGIRELSLTNPGLWKLGTLGKILKIVDAKLLRAPHPRLVLRLRLSGNWGLTTAGDFVFSFPLSDEGSAGIEAYPSQASLKIPNVLEAKGLLQVADRDGKRSVSGALDLNLQKLGLRLHASARVDSVSEENDHETAVSALVTAAKVEFLTPYPIVGSGLALRSVEGLYASHFRRVENPGREPVPPALEWLQRAKGEVIGSVSDQSLWEPAYDHWAVGFGAGLGIQANERLVNLNALLAVEEPGPRIILFAKARVMKGALSNPEAIKNLTNSILGVLEIDLAKDEVSFAALARVEFGKFLSLEAPLLLRFAFGDSRDWELALGTYKRPVQTHIDVFGILRGRAGGFFMAGGDGLDGVPVSGPGVMTGFAVAFGFFARLTIGKGTIYVRASSRTLLAASFGDALFAHGRMRIQGELMLIFVGVGVSADFSFVFLRPPSGDEAIAITGSVSGSVRIGWFKISGSLTIRIGGRISDRSAFPSLLRQVSILSGNNVSLFGQGTAGPIDGKLAVLPPAEPSGSTPERPEVTDVPLDAVIAMSFVTSPDLPGQQTSQTEGTLALAGVSAPGPRTVRFGSRTGRYVVDELSLTRLLPDGGEEPLPPERIPARWWESAQSRGDEPTALSLALFTRNPLGFENAAISSDTLRGWLKALDRNVCSSVPARRCLYTPGPGQQEKEGRWLMSPLPWESADTDRGAIDPVTVEALTPDGIEYDSLKPSGHDERLWFLRLVPVSTPLENGEVALDPPRLQLFCRAHHTEPVRLLLGLSSRQAYREVHIEITSRSGALRRSYTATDLDLEELRQEADGNWERAVEGFASLASEPETQDWVFGVIVVPTEDFSDHDPIATVTLSIKAAKLPHYAPLLFGGLSMLPSSEVERYAADEARRSSRLEELEEYLTGKDAPLLQANSLYRLYLSWSVKGDGDEHGDERFYFRTVSQPPTSADPYVLTHFPQSGESFHYAEQTPGIAFAGTEVFRILAQFPDARLRVRITTDDGTSLTDSDETSRWYDGVILDPEALVDPLKEPPPGILTKQIASLPSALRHALRQALLQQEGPLACVDGISLPSSGLWVGFDTALLPDKGYEVTVELVDADGKLWPHSTNEEHRRPFYRWMFRTGRYPSLRAHAAAIGSGVLRRRLLQGCDDGACLSFGEDRPSRIKTVPDKVFEDTVASAVGERWDRSTRNRRTLLCARNADKFEAVALLVESDSPLVRYTTAPTIKLLEEFNSHVAESTDHPLLEIDLNNSRGIEGVTLTASGFALLAYLEPGTDPATAGVAISTVPVDRIPVIAAETAFLGGKDE